MEAWKDILRHEGKYQINRSGTVRSLDRYVAGKLGSKRFQKGVTLRPYIDKHGYIRVVLYNEDNKAKHLLLHRVIAENYLVKKEGKDVVNHIDGNKTNNSVENLEWVTTRENVIHAVRNDLIKRNILKSFEVEEVVEGISDGFTTKEIANYYDVKPHYIRGIALGRKHSSITGISEKIKMPHFEKNREGFRGEHTHNALLTDEEVREVRRLAKNHWSQRKIGVKFNISKSSIADIVNNKTYKYITQENP